LGGGGPVQGDGDRRCGVGDGAGEVEQVAGDRAVFVGVLQVGAQVGGQPEFCIVGEQAQSRPRLVTGGGECCRTVPPVASHRHCLITQSLRNSTKAKMPRSVISKAGELAKSRGTPRSLMTAAVGLLRSTRRHSAGK